MKNTKVGKMGNLPNDLLKSHFNSLDYKTIGVDEDGSCFFHSVCAIKNKRGYLNKNSKQRRKIGLWYRKKIRHDISKKNWTKIWENRGVRDIGLPSLNRIKEMLDDSATWADVYIIIYVMDIENLNILFFDISNRSLYCGVRGYQQIGSQDMACIAWINHSHFEPIVRVHKDKETVTIYTADDPLVEHMKKHYISHFCCI